MKYENTCMRQPTVLPGLIWPTFVLFVASLLFLI